MSPTRIIFRRELAAYFATPLAYIFIIIFLMLTGIFTFYLGNFFGRGQADLQSFFNFHPWLYLFLIPAIAMRIWSEERKAGTIELLLTLPITMSQAVWGKFLAAWAFIGIALAGTLPFWITVNVLGDPDNGIIVAAYLGSLLMAGAYLAVGICISAATKSQVIAFIVSLMVCFGFTLAGFPLVQDVFSTWLPDIVTEAIASLSFLTHFQAISKGVIDLRDVIFFAAFIAAWLYASAIVIDLKKAD